MRKSNVVFSASLLVLPLLAGCGAGERVLDGDQTASFSTAPGEPNHEAITRAALAFLRPEILESLVVGNVSTDVEFFTVNANHFDDCNFSGGSAVVSGEQAAAVEKLNPADPSPLSEALALLSFSRSLHAVQDFYAHSNWVELGGEVLVDDSLGPFPTLAPYMAIPSTGFVVIQGDKARKTALNRDEDAAYPESAIVEYKTKQGRAPGLISGTVDYEPGDFCPSSVAMTHDELNKDRSTLADRTLQYEAAKALAIEQTTHEWCRLAALTTAAWGDSGAARLASWVAAGATAPDCSAQ